MELVVVTANALIELANNNKPMFLQYKSLIDYAEIVSDILDDKVDTSMVSLNNLKINYNKFIEVVGNDMIIPATNITTTDLSARFRSNISHKEYLAFTSVKARESIGIKGLHI